MCRSSAWRGAPCEPSRPKSRRFPRAHHAEVAPHRAPPHQGGQKAQAIRGWCGGGCEVRPLCCRPRPDCIAHPNTTPQWLRLQPPWWGPPQPHLLGHSPGSVTAPSPQPSSQSAKRALFEPRGPECRTAVEALTAPSFLQAIRAPRPKKVGLSSTNVAPSDNKRAFQPLGWIDGFGGCVGPAKQPASQQSKPFLSQGGPSVSFCCQGAHSPKNAAGHPGPEAQAMLDCIQPASPPHQQRQQQQRSLPTLGVD